MAASELLSRTAAAGFLQACTIFIEIAVAVEGASLGHYGPKRVDGTAKLRRALCHLFRHPVLQVVRAAPAELREAPGQVLRFMGILLNLNW